MALAATGVYPALHVVEYCSSGFCGSCSRLIAACMSAAFTCAAFLLLMSAGGGGGAVSEVCVLLSTVVFVWRLRCLR